VVLRGGAPVELSGLELKLLRYFVEHRGALLTRDELLEKRRSSAAVTNLGFHQMADILRAITAERPTWFISPPSSPNAPE